MTETLPIFWKGEGRRLNKDRINTSPQTKLCWSLSLQHPVHAHPFPVVNVKQIEYNFHFIVCFSVHFILHRPENLKSITISSVEIKLVRCGQGKVKRSCHFVWQRCETPQTWLDSFSGEAFKCHRWLQLLFWVFCCVVTDLEQSLLFNLFCLGLTGEHKEPDSRTCAEWGEEPQSFLPHSVQTVWSAHLCVSFKRNEAFV